MVLSLVAASVVLTAQDQQPSFHAGVDAVEVYASVTDRQGVPITGLTRNQFTVTEDGRPQTIDTFAEANVPLSVALAVDRSWSMAGEPLVRARRAGRLFLDSLVAPDQAMVMAVSGRVEVVAPLSGDLANARAALDRLDPWSTTALHDAVIQAVDLVQAGTGRRALVLLSDGVDRYSHATAGDVTLHVRARDVMVYPVSVGRSPSELFAELATLTGGRSFHAHETKTLESAMRAIANDLHHQYLLGYTPAARDSKDTAGAWRAITVRVNVAAAEVRARQGYVAR